MNILERNLVRAINSGRSFALIGSGPSCDLGMPSWRQLAEHVLESLTNDADIQQAKGFLDSKQYAKFFGLAGTALGIETLLKIIEEKLSREWHSGRVYDYLVSWPFQSYLTTNFDNQLYRHLRNVEPSAVTRLNSEEDVRTLHSTVKNVIFKIHGDFSMPEDIVLTEKQYLDFQQSPKRLYWRDTIFTLLRMVDLVMVGYSLSDPDFNQQLERANQIASPDHPVFMFATDIDQSLIHKYFFEKNIHIISYKNERGNHEGLKKVLARYAPFIAKRGSAVVGMELPDPMTSNLASSLHLFTRTRIADESSTCITRSCAALLLQILSSLGERKVVMINEMLDLLKTKIFASVGVDPKAFTAGLQHLYDNGLIEKPHTDKVVISPNGLRLLKGAAADRKIMEEKFNNICHSFLIKEHENLAEQAIESVIKCMKAGLIRAFEKRGIEIANSVFSNALIDVSDATDILEIINKYGNSLATLEERSAFTDLMIEVLLKASHEIKEYLGALSQGYFAYHALALDQNCSDERLNLARGKTWILDSSMILALLATNSLNYDYARDFLERMKQLGLRCCTTEKLFYEVQEHADWAIRNFAGEPSDSPRLLLAVQAGAGYKQNLFLDGFTKWSASQGNPKLYNYMAECLGKDYPKDLAASTKKQILNLGIDVLPFSQWPGFSETLFERRDRLSEQIADSRRSRSTYSGSSQCDAEAEVVIITEMANVVFLSQSSFLNNYSSKPIVWKPETMFRFLTLFSSVPPATDMLYQCMTQDFFYAGFDIIDEQSITNYASPLVHQARMKLETERAEYEKVLGKDRLTELEAKFEQTPDAQKPFYSMQFAFYVASQAEALRKIAVERATRAEDRTELTQKERKQYERLKAKQEQRKRKAIQGRRRKQSKQSKKRRKKSLTK